MYRLLLGLIASFFLAACGSDESPNGQVSQGDEISVTLSASSTSIDAGETVVLNATAMTSAGTNLEPTISCDGGTLFQGSFLLTEAVASDAVITCQASAANGAANVTDSVEITVSASTDTVSLAPQQSSDVSQGEVILLVTEGLNIDDGSLQVTLAGGQVPAEIVAQNTIALGVPSGAPVGSQLLELQTGERRFGLPLTIASSTLSAPAEIIVADVLEGLESRLLNLASGSSLSQSERDEVEQLAEEISLVRADLDQFTDAELTEIAYLVEVNGVRELFAQRALQADCTVPRTQELLVGVRSIAIGAILTAGGAVPLGVGFLTFGFLVASDDAITIIQSCLRVDDIDLEQDTAQNSTLTQIKSVAAVPLGIDLINGEAKQFRVFADEEFSDDEDAQFIVRVLRRAVDFLPFAPAQLNELLDRAENPQRVRIPAQEVTIEKVSGDGVTIQSSVVGNSVAITASATNPTSSRTEFSFSASFRGGSRTFDAVLVTQEPIAFDSVASVTEFSSSAIALNVQGADSIMIQSQPARGSVEAIQGSNEVVFTLQESFVGRLTFDYVALNRFGQSQPATVLLEVESNFEGDFDLTVLETVRSSDPAGYCESLTRTIPAGIRRQSENEYRLFYNGFLGPSSGSILMTPLNFGSADPPNFGLNGFSRFEIEIDGGVSVVTLDIQLLNNEIRGTGTFSFSDGEGSCAGSLAVSGIRSP